MKTKKEHKEVTTICLQCSKDIQQLESGFQRMITRQDNLYQVVESIRSQLTVQDTKIKAMEGLVHDLMQRLKQHTLTIDAHNEPIRVKG